MKFCHKSWTWLSLIRLWIRFPFLHNHEIFYLFFPIFLNLPDMTHNKADVIAMNDITPGDTPIPTFSIFFTSLTIGVVVRSRANDPQLANFDISAFPFFFSAEYREFEIAVSLFVCRQAHALELFSHFKCDGAFRSTNRSRVLSQILLETSR